MCLPRSLMSSGSWIGNSRSSVTEHSVECPRSCLSAATRQMAEEAEIVVSVDIVPLYNDPQRSCFQSTPASALRINPNTVSNSAFTEYGGTLLSPCGVSLWAPTNPFASRGVRKCSLSVVSYNLQNTWPCPIFVVTHMALSFPMPAESGEHATFWL